MSHQRRRPRSPRTPFDPPGAGHLLQPSPLLRQGGGTNQPSLLPRSCPRPLLSLLARGGGQDTLRALPAPCVCFTLSSAAKRLQVTGTFKDRLGLHRIRAAGAAREKGRCPQPQNELRARGEPGLEPTA